MVEVLEFGGKKRFTWQQIHEMCQFLALRIEHDLEGKLDGRYLIAIARGGCIPAVIISHMLKIPLKHTISVSSYDGHTRKGITDIDGLIKGMTPAEQRQGMWVDDIIDTGNSIQALHSIYPHARFVSPLCKDDGIAKVRHLMVCQPVITVRNDVWVEFPWESDLEQSNTL